MKKTITTLLAGLLPAIALWAGDPVVVTGNLKVAGEGSLTSAGEVTLRAADNTNGIIVNNGTMKLKGLNIQTNTSKDGMLLNYGTVTLDGTSVGADFKVTRKVKNDDWCYMSFPFDVKISEITNENGTKLVLGDYQNYKVGDLLWIRELDPVEAMKEGSDGLKSITNENAYLKAGKGYLIATEIASAKSIVFKASTGDGFNLASLFAKDKEVELTYIENTNLPRGKKGWNFVGSKQLSGFTLNSNNTGDYVGAIYLLKSDKTFDVFLSNSAQKTIPNFLAFYTQVFGPDEVMIYSVDGMTSSDASDNLLRSSRVSENSGFDLVLIGDKNSDKCMFAINDEYADGYKVREDFFKLFSSSDVSQIWSDEDLVINSIPSDIEREVNVGVIAGDDKEHTIEIAGYTGNEFREINLIDRVKGTKHNLLKTGYSFETAAGKKIEDRFALQFLRAATGIESSVADQEVVTYASDMKLYVKNIVAGDKVLVYNLSGALAAETISESSEVMLPLAAEGVFIVKVSGNTNHVSKVANK